MHIAVENRWMDVRLAADRRGITQHARNGFNRAQRVPLRRGLGIRVAEFAKRCRSEHRAEPRAKVLRREISPGNFPQVRVDIRGVHVLPAPMFVEILKELLAGKIAALLDDTRETAIVDTDTVPLPALSSELKPQGRSLHLDVLIAQRRQAERIVGFRVLVVADANQAALEQLHHRGEHLLARQPWPLEIGGRSRANHRQHGGEGFKPIELVAVAMGAPIRMISI